MVLHKLVTPDQPSLFKSVLQSALDPMLILRNLIRSAASRDLLNAHLQLLHIRADMHMAAR